MFTVLLLDRYKVYSAGFFLCFSHSSKKCQHSRYTELPGSAPEEMIVLIKVTAAKLELALRRRRYYRQIH